MSGPVVADQSVFVGSPHEDILRLGWPNLELMWRLPAEDFHPETAFREILVLLSFPTLRYRGVRFGGEIAWTLEHREGGELWGLHGDRLISCNPGFFVADVTTGQVVDHYSVPGPLIAPIRLCDEILVFSRKDGSDPVAGYDTARRAIVWQKDLRQEILSLGHGLDDRPYFSLHCGSARRAVIVCGKSLFGFSAVDGQILWHTPLWVASRPPVVHEGRIYAWAWSQDDKRVNRFVCVDEATGDIVYDVPLVKHGGEFAMYQQVWTGSVNGGHIAFGTDFGLLAVFRLSDGELMWSYKHKSQVYDPVLHDNRLLVTSADGNLLVFESEAV